LPQRRVEEQFTLLCHVRSPHAGETYERGLTTSFASIPMDHLPQRDLARALRRVSRLLWQSSSDAR
jgi:hypothetical protein